MRAISFINHLPPTPLCPLCPSSECKTDKWRIRSYFGSTENVGSLLPDCLGTPTRDPTIFGRVNVCANLRHLGDITHLQAICWRLTPHTCSSGSISGWDERFCLPLALPGQPHAWATCHCWPTQTLPGLPQLPGPHCRDQAAHRQKAFEMAGSVVWGLGRALVKCYSAQTGLLCIQLGVPF